MHNRTNKHVTRSYSILSLTQMPLTIFPQYNISDMHNLIVHMGFQEQQTLMYMFCHPHKCTTPIPPRRRTKSDINIIYRIDELLAYVKCSTSFEHCLNYYIQQCKYHISCGTCLAIRWKYNIHSINIIFK